MFEFRNGQNPVLKDPAIQQKLETDGYIIVPFYTEDDIVALTRHYFDITPMDDGGFRPTTYIQDVDYRTNASNAIRAAAMPHLERILKDFKAYMGSYIVKHPDKNSELGLHQDMTLVDESRFMGINLWAPLCDTTNANGALHLIPGSHRIFPTYRAATIPNIYDQHASLIRRYMQPVYMKAGEAILFDNSLLHFSPPNLSEAIRIATNVFITHQDAVITICYNDRDKGQIELFEQEDTFFTNYEQFGNDSNHLRPKIGTSIGFTDYDFPVLTPRIMKSKYGSAPAAGWLEKLKSVFG